MSTYRRKTRDTWQFWIDYGYGEGFEHECTELSRADMVENRKAYRENLRGLARCAVLQIRKRREPIEPANG